MMVILIPLALLAMATSQSASVVVPPGGQVGAAATGEAVTAEQITAPRRRDAIDQLPREASRPPLMPQIASPAGEARPLQGVPSRGGAISAPQLGPGARSAAAPPSPTLRAEGRRTEIVRVAGKDRCDPQAPQAGDARCQRVIETRSAEFERPAAPALSPEQRLLLDHESRSVRSIGAAAQRVARNEVDADATDTQALAAISLGQAADAIPPSPASPQPPSGTETIIQIIEAARAAPPKP